jgi:hypothetical protein
MIYLILILIVFVFILTLFVVKLQNKVGELENKWDTRPEMWNTTPTASLAPPPATTLSAPIPITNWDQVNLNQYYPKQKETLEVTDNFDEIEKLDVDQIVTTTNNIPEYTSSKDIEEYWDEAGIDPQDEMPGEPLFSEESEYSGEEEDEMPPLPVFNEVPSEYILSEAEIEELELIKENALKASLEGAQNIPTLNQGYKNSKSY